MRRVGLVGVVGLVALGGACEPVVIASRWGFALHPGQGAVPLDAVIRLDLEGAGMADVGDDVLADAIRLVDLTAADEVPFDVVRLDATALEIVPRAPLVPEHDYRVEGADLSGWHRLSDEQREATPACVTFSTSTDVRVVAAVRLGEDAVEHLRSPDVSLVFSEPMDPDDVGLVTALTADGEEIGGFTLDVDPQRPWVWGLGVGEPIVAVIVPAGARALSGRTTGADVALAVTSVLDFDYAWWTRTQVFGDEADTMTAGCLLPWRPR